MKRLGIGLFLSAAAVCALPAQAYVEAPMLRAQVKARHLPPLVRRLPAAPQKITPLDEPGIYGGTLRSALRGAGDTNSLTRLVGPQGLVRWSRDFNSVEPNVAESYRINADATEYTFTLRQGMRWSDGAPLTADDVVFAMTDLVANHQFYPHDPAAFTAGGALPEVTRVDALTVRFRFAAPYAGFLEQLATPQAQQPVLWQKKYCSQFHPRYNPRLAELMQREGVKDWPQLMRLKCGDTEAATRWSNPARPTLDPWVVRRPYNGSQSVEFERNPYFWQVDTLGRQLPYIDRLQFTVADDVDAIVQRAVRGELDFQLRHIGALEYRSTLAAGQAAGAYRVINGSSITANALGLWLNQSTRNDKLRRLIRQKDFRAALSLGLNRREISDNVFQGQATPWQLGPANPASRWYNARLGTQYLNFDARNAAELLDKLGLTRRDVDGFRQYADGGRVSLTAIVSLASPSHIDVLEIVRQQWAKLGIELQIQSCERACFNERAVNNQYDISADAVAGGADAGLNPRAYVAVHPQDSRMSMEWTRHYLSGGKAGETPSPSMQKRLALYEKLQSAHSSAEAERLFKDILAEAADAFEIIGTVRLPPDTGIRKTRLSNVPDKLWQGWTYPSPAPALPQQWFFAP